MMATRIAPLLLAVAVFAAMWQDDRSASSDQRVVKRMTKPSELTQAETAETPSGMQRVRVGNGELLVPAQLGPGRYTVTHPCGKQMRIEISGRTPSGNVQTSHSTMMTAAGLWRFQRSPELQMLAAIDRPSH